MTTPLKPQRLLNSLLSSRQQNFLSKLCCTASRPLNGTSQCKPHACFSTPPTAPSTKPPVEKDLPMVEDIKKFRLAELASAGIAPFPRFIGNEEKGQPTTLEDMYRWDGNLAKGEKRHDTKVSVTGRLTSKRTASTKLVFFTVYQNGREFQVVSSLRMVPSDDTSAWNSMHHCLKRGDIVRFTGVPGKTNIGTMSLFTTHVPELLSPCLANLPSSSFKNKEERLRNRCVDMIVNRKVAEILKKRTQVIRYIRRYLDDRGFLEVETPLLSGKAGGANARPFTTRGIESLDFEMALRIAPELFLKQLVIGGIDKVYELGKQFRNEGMDRDHNPEFSTCEFYQAYMNLEGLFAMTEDMLHGIVESVTGSSKCPLPAARSPLVGNQYHENDEEEDVDAGTEKNTLIDYSPPYRRIDVLAELERKCGVTFPNLEGDGALKALVDICDRMKVTVKSPVTLTRVLDQMISELIEPECIQPTFLYGHPIVMSPLAKGWVNEHGQAVSARFELFVGGTEIVNAYEELNDPDEQRRRFAGQLKDRNQGDAESQLPDEDYCKSLEYGLPPTGGWGMGIDRVVQLVTGMRSIRDVLTFPVIRPKPL